MELISSGFYAGVDDRACRRAELGRIGARLNTELLQGIRWRLYHLYRAFLKVRRTRVVVGSVQRKVVLRFPISIRAEAVRRGIVRVCKISLYPRLEQCQIRVAAAIQAADR